MHFKALIVLVGPLILSGIVAAQKPTTVLKIEDVMTATELKDTGVTGLTTSQRRALNDWLNRYTRTVASVVAQQNTAESAAPTTPGTKSTCAPAIESTIAGDFEGWSGETIFKLDNGQIWEQAEYDYTYSYSYRPSVTIYAVTGGCRLKVEDEDETILVRRIR